MEKANDTIIDLLKSGKPFSISRLGAEHILVSKYLKAKVLVPFQQLDINAGIYHNNVSDLVVYCKMVNKSIKTCKHMATYDTLCVEQQDYFCDKYDISRLPHRILEPYFVMEKGKTPWSHYLKGKKVLIVSPFVESFKKQIDNGFKFFKDSRIFVEDQDFIFYKTYNTSGKNHIHSSWLETFLLMKKDIEKLDFDIALLSCGGYGLPLLNLIRNDMGKSAIYMGGSLQICFGVVGKRWEEHGVISKFIKDNGNFIRPSGDEIIPRNKMIEGGCYW